MRVYYFGCWNVSGHYLFAPGGGHVPYEIEDRIVYYNDRAHIDGSLAPRRYSKSWLAKFGEICWSGQGKDKDERLRIGYDSEECPQGQFLHHHLNNGYTAISWWDRNQGDTRGACNSSILMEGVHTSEEMLAALAKHFPSVLENLNKAKVSLVQVELPK